MYGEREIVRADCRKGRESILIYKLYRKVFDFILVRSEVTHTSCYFKTRELHCGGAGGEEQTVSKFKLRHIVIKCNALHTNFSVYKKLHSM